MNQLEHIKKQLRYRSWHRGTREMDLLLGPFFDQYFSLFSESQLNLYANFLENNDPDLYDWIMGYGVVPDLYKDIIALVHKFLKDRTL
ncbi:MAG: succinate dehydrogenase assembly factor 2 [Alphaproteobacteria bacterium]|nr:succinate dehydrogenase assembly factor 2 [Alphaproteobacteria bacterium]